LELGKALRAAGDQRGKSKRSGQLAHGHTPMRRGDEGIIINIVTVDWFYQL
jgi:hypothetical protein